MCIRDRFIDTFKHLYKDHFIVIGNKYNIRSRNGTDIIFISEKQKQAFIGKSITHAYFDEVEFFDNFGDVLLSLVPLMNKNHNNLICGGSKKNGYRKISSPATFTFNALDNPIRDLNWVISTIKSIGLEAFENEYAT